MPENLQDLTSSLLAAAKKAGADAADALAVDDASIAIEVRMGALEHAERSEGTKIGLRVLIGNRQACVSASDTRNDTIEMMAERAVAMAREAPEDPTIGLASPDQLCTDWDLAKLEMADPTADPKPAELEELARTAEAAALAVDGVSKVQTSSAAYGRSRVHLAATNGFSGQYERTSNSLYAVAIAGEGSEMERDHYGESRVFRDDMPAATDIGRQAGERTIERIGASQPPTGAFPVLFDERIASGLIGHLLSAINGMSIARGSSWLLDAMGEQVLPANLSIIENSLRPRISGSRPFDAEGLPKTKRTIVENGILKSWTLDLATGRKLGLPSTGNATRGTSSPPSPATGPFALTQGTQTRADLISEMGTGLLITSMIGASINPNTGDYSRGATGFWVENGEIAYPVNECTIAGNLRDMLRTIIPANDARQELSAVVPSLLVEGLTIAGK